MLCVPVCRSPLHTVSLASDSVQAQQKVLLWYNVVKSGRWHVTSCLTNLNNFSWKQKQKTILAFITKLSSYSAKHGEKQDPLHWFSRGEDIFPETLSSHRMDKGAGLCHHSYCHGTVLMIFLNEIASRSLDLVFGPECALWSIILFSTGGVREEVPCVCFLAGFTPTGCSTVISLSRGGFSRDWSLISPLYRLSSIISFKPLQVETSTSSVPQ